MKIGFDAKRIFHNRTGLGNYGRDVIRILRHHAPEFDLILFNPKPIDGRSGNPNGQISVEIPNGWFWKLFPALWRLRGISGRIRSTGLDIYHGLSGEIPLGLKNLAVQKVVTVHDLIFLSHPQFYSAMDRLIYTWKIKYAVRACDRILAISQQTKRDLVHFLKVDPNKIDVVYQGCNEIFKQPRNEARIEEVRRKFELPDEFLLNVGTIQERKNALSLVKAVRDTPYTLVLVGSAKSYIKKVREFIRQHGMEKQVRILHGVGLEDLAALYQGAALFCYPSLCEGFGIPIIEALYSRTPVITSIGGCFSEAAGPSSVYIPPQDIPAIREAICTWMEDPEKRAEAAKEGFAFVQKFNDSEVARHLKEFYEKVKP